MSPKKCRKCGLVNADSDCGCRRCGAILDTPSMIERARREQPKRGTFLYTLLAATLLGAAGYYIIHGFEDSYKQISADEAKRLAAQPRVQQAPQTSRFESDQRAAEPFKNAVANSPNLTASQKHDNDVKQMMRSANTSR